MQNNNVVPSIEFMCSYLPNSIKKWTHKISPFPLINKDKKLINMPFVRSLSSEEKAAIVLNFVSPCNTSHVTDLHFRLTLIPEMRACALSARNLPRYFGGKFHFLFSLSLTKPVVFGVSFEYIKEAN